MYSCDLVGSQRSEFNFSSDILSLPGNCIPLDLNSLHVNPDSYFCPCEFLGLILNFKYVMRPVGRFDYY